jgi:hypothetical protein
MRFPLTPRLLNFIIFIVNDGALMPIRDPLDRLWHEQVSRTHRRDLRDLYEGTDWKFVAAVLALLASVALALAYVA